MFPAMKTENNTALIILLSVHMQGFSLTVVLKQNWKFERINCNAMKRIPEFVLSRRHSNLT